VSEGDVAACAEQIVGYQFRDPDLLTTSLTHSSIADSRVMSNERLEFLGDAVLGMVVCSELYSSFSEWLEGDLTKVKSLLVSRQVCAEIADETGLTSLLILGNGIGNRRNMPKSLRAAVFESVIGAVYVDGGLEPAKRFIVKTIAPHLEKCVDSQHLNNFKSALQQYAQHHLGATPHYEALDEQGPDHSKCFEVCVVLGGERFPSAWGPSKKESEQEAAKRTLTILRERDTTRTESRKN
jgi:ribonuclease-3